MSIRKVDHHYPHALYGVEATRQIEQHAQSALPPNTLMQRAGLAVAQLALALAPHSRQIWVACGPGNNGGDGLEAAWHLQQWGRRPVVTWLGQPGLVPQDAAMAYQKAMASGVSLVDTPPNNPDLCIDALLGLGSQARPPDKTMATWIDRMNAGTASVLAVDLPTGLHADTGVTSATRVKAHHTLSLLTLKPGLFMAEGRDVAGHVWLADLGRREHPIDSNQGTQPATAWLSGSPCHVTRSHASHKGSYGDVVVVGGAPGMTGAALLAATSALTAGAGRVFVSLLDEGSLRLDSCQPELMFRALSSLDLSQMTVVCGCGGGDEIQSHLVQLLTESNSTVFDADALNAIASQPNFRALLTKRESRSARTVLTPHPLEAARLLGCTVAAVQNDRLAGATTLAQRFACVVVLKGSGTVIAAPDQISFINPTGNAKLATAGTGDVLAGMVAAALASGKNAFQAACEAVYHHGQLADEWPMTYPLTAGSLSKSH